MQSQQKLRIISRLLLGGNADIFSCLGGFRTEVQIVLVLRFSLCWNELIFNSELPDKRLLPQQVYDTVQAKVMEFQYLRGFSSQDGLRLKRPV